jgi:hypothetical protein
MSGLFSVELVKCAIFLNFILTYLKSSIISYHFRKTVSLGTFAFGVEVSE